MDPKPRPNHRRYLEALERMGPEGRLRKACELSDLTRSMFMQALRERFPDATPAEFRKIVIERVLRWSNSNY
ncbi:MAG TPA: hypothetical protein VEA69_11020 [Tepidisphaeraceae bacterium]|nr:hypothetical protein [Tepidisphaeraceae bacterium]